MWLFTFCSNALYVWPFCDCLAALVPTPIDTRKDFLFYDVEGLTIQGNTGMKMQTKAMLYGGVAATAIMTILLIGNAQAQDFNVPSANKFTGCGLGVTGGWNSVTSSADYHWGPISAGADLGGTGSQFGLLAGCDINVSEFVFGVWGDYTWMDTSSSVWVGPYSTTISYDNQWSVYGRVGYLLTDDTLVYGLAGFTELDADTVKVAGFGKKLGTFEGRTYGLGVETALDMNWRIGLEARYDDLDGKMLRHVALPGDKLYIDPDVTSVRVSLKYKFGGVGVPPPLK